MRFRRLAIPDVVAVEPHVHADRRGFFLECWNQRRFSEGGVAASFVQENHSRSVQYTLRGLHYQLEHPQGKLVRVVHGEVFDVAVDIRRSSPTFGRWVGESLSADNRRGLWVPAGFAHGFVVLSSFADLIYLVTDYYDADDQRSIRWDDPALAIAWPLPRGVNPVLSVNDARANSLDTARVFP